VIRISRPRINALVVAVIAIASRARAAGEDEVRCMTSYEQGQTLKRQGKLAAARAAFATCKSTCPAVFARDCGRWQSEAEALSATVRIRAVDDDGRPLDDVRVLVDGELLADPAPTADEMVDPGERMFRFERAGAPPVQVIVSLQPGERAHPVRVTLHGSARRFSALELAPARPPESSEARGSKGPSYALAGVGAVSLAVSGVLLVKGHVDRGHLADTCSPACDPQELDPIRTMWWASAATAVAGIVSFALAVVLWPRQRSPGLRP
jgi:hypothetical protein